MGSEAKLLTLRSGSTDERRKGWETSARVKVIRQRRARCETQEQLALWLGCSVDAVQLWETGKRRVPGWVLEALDANKTRDGRHAAQGDPARLAGIQGHETATASFYLPKGLTKRLAPQDAPGQPCAEQGSYVRECTHGRGVTQQGDSSEALESVARRAA